ncbi:MAG: flagellar motor switch protein FliN [Pseudomonadales bacterium]|nr:flagellar motor switch protein FliN [Pseudomonadales bacterium]MCP5215361.1 flagellar motor switch protein FliN [Pseudomonadales bacterium]
MADEDNQVEEEVAVDSAEESAVEQDWQESEQRTAAEPANLEELRDEGRRVNTATPELDVILDIPVSISMEVGNTDITIRNLLQLNQGSVIELDRLAGEPLDVRVNGTLIAHGEVVVVNDKFGIRLTDVVSPSERIKKLR